jgi:hypothetical protein
VKLLIHLDNGNDGDGLDHCTVTITAALARRIKLLSNTIKKRKVVYIEEWGSPDEFYTEEDQVCEARLDCEMLRMSDDDFYWKGYFKHGDTSWSTDSVPMKVIDEILKVSRTPRNRLPLMIGTLESEDAQKLLERRLKTRRTKS